MWNAEAISHGMAFGHDTKGLEDSNVLALGIQPLHVVVILGLIKTLVAIALGRTDEVMLRGIRSSTEMLFRRKSL